MRAIRKRYLPRSAPGHPPPDPLVRRARRRDGAVHVGGAGLGHLGEDLLGGGADRLEGRAACGVDELAVDEQPVGRADVDDGARLRRGGVLELCHGLRCLHSVDRDVVGAGVGTRGQLLTLQEEVVEQAGGAEPEPRRVEPVRRPAISLTDHQVLQRVLAGPDAAGRLDADLTPVTSRQSRTASSMIMVTGSVAAGDILPVEVLMKSRAGQHRQPRGAPDVVVGRPARRSRGSP